MSIRKALSFALAALMLVACFGAGDIHSNVCDMLRWNRALFGGELLGDQQLEYMTTLRGGYSCGWQEDGFDGLGHGGTTPSYNSYNAVIEAENGERFYAV